MNWHAVTLSLQVTAVATLLLFVIGLALAYLLARRRVPGQIVLETLINLPLVLPPSVIGYYMLLALGRGSPLVEWLDIRLVFTWKAAVLASTVVGLPLMVQTARAAIASVDPALEHAASASSGHSRRVDSRLGSGARRVRRDADGSREHSRSDSNSPACDL